MLELPAVLAATDPGDFFTGESLGTFAGASGATIVVANALRKVTKLDTPWIPFVIAIIAAYVASAVTGDPKKFVDFALIFLNGCLLFCTALGINDKVIGDGGGGGGGAAERRTGGPGLRSRWLKR